MWWEPPGGRGPGVTGQAGPIEPPPWGPGTRWEWVDAEVCGATHPLQVKSVKPCLKQLQQCIQTISTLHDDEILPSNPADLFHWLPKEHMCVLVYLVSRQGGPRREARWPRKGPQ